MKNFKFLKYTFALVGLSIFWIFNYLFANSEYYYKNLTVNADIQQDGTIQVNEIFDAYFNVRKHGIIRNIPLKYTIDGKKFRIFLENIRVEGRNSSVYDSYGEKEIKIGDSNRELIGDQRYSIRYSVYGLIRNFAGKGREELSWNVIPNGFDTHIDHVRIELKLPKAYTGFTSEDFLIAADGKSNKVEDFEGTIDWSQGDKIILTYDKTIPEGNGITLSVKFPVGYFDFNHERQESLIDKYDILSLVAIDTILPSFLQEKKNRLNAHGGFIVNGQRTNHFYNIMIVLLGIGFVFFHGLYKRWEEKDQRGKEIVIDHGLKPITVQYYPPEGINSAEAGILYHKKFKAKSMLSLFYQWCAKGLVSMNYRDNQIIIRKIKNIDDVPQYEKKFFNKFFSSNEIALDKDSHLYTIINEKCLIDYGKEKQRFYGVKAVNVFDLIFVIGIIIAIRTLPILETTQIDPFHVHFVISFILMYYYFGGKFLTVFAGLIFLVYNIIFFGESSDNVMGIMIFFLPFFLDFLLIVYVGIKQQVKTGTELKFSEKGVSLHEYLCGYQQFLEYCATGRLQMFLKEDPLFFDKTIAYAVSLGVDIKTLINKFKPVYEKNPKDLEELMNILSMFSSIGVNREKEIAMECNSYNASHSGSSASYDRDSGFSSGSSRDSGSSSGSSGGGGGGGGGRSW